VLFLDYALEIYLVLQQVIDATLPLDTNEHMLELPPVAEPNMCLFMMHED